MSASKLAEQIAVKHNMTRLRRLETEPILMPNEKAVAALDEMALRVFEYTRERAAKIAADAIAPNRRDIADAIRAMQPEPGGTK